MNFGNLFVNYLWLIISFVASVSGVVGAQKRRRISIVDIRYVYLLKRRSFLAGFSKTKQLASLSAFGNRTRRWCLRVSGQRSSSTDENGLSISFRWVRYSILYPLYALAKQIPETTARWLRSDATSHKQIIINVPASFPQFDLIETESIQLDWMLNYS